MEKEVKVVKRTRKPKQTKEDVKNKYLVPFGENNIVSLSVEMTRDNGNTYKIRGTEIPTMKPLADKNASQEATEE